MRILIVNYEYPPLGGGGGVACRQIAEELAKHHEVDVLTSGFKDLANREIDSGVNVIRVPVMLRRELATASLLSMYSYFPSSLILGISLMGKKHYDVINTWFAIPSGPSGHFLSRLNRVPNVLTIVGGDIHDPTKSYSPHRNVILRKVVNWIIEKADAVTSISIDTKDRASQYYGVSRNMEVISLGIKEPSFSQSTRSVLKLPEGDFLIAAVGRLVRRKGYSYLLDAVARLSRQDVRVLIMGDGPDEALLRAQAQRLMIDDRVVFCGLVSEEKKYQMLSCSDLFVLPSLHEGFGLVFLEAMYCGLPVITSDNGGQRDFLMDGETGFLVPAEDISLLTARIELLLTDSTLRQRMGVYNKSYVKSFFIEGVASRYEALFRKVMEERS